MARARVTDDAALLTAAASVFREKGYRGTTISDIADAAGVSRPTLYSYAGSKQWLLDRIVRELLDRTTRLLDADCQAGRTPWQRLHAVVARHVVSAVENGGFYAILLSEESELSPETREYYRVVATRNTAIFRSLLDDCAPENRGDILDTTIAANLIVSMLSSLHRWYDPDGPVGLTQLTEQITLVVRRVLGDAPVPTTSPRTQGSPTGTEGRPE